MNHYLHPGRFIGFSPPIEEKDVGQLLRNFVKNPEMRGQ
jgi:hypothetical protein